MAKTASTQPLRALSATFTYAQARNAGLSKHTLYRLRDGGCVAAISRGLYRQAGAEPADTNLIAIAVKAPRATLCLETALARHGLSDAIPVAPTSHCLAERESLPQMHLPGGTTSRPALSTSAGNCWPWTEPSASASTTPRAASSTPSARGPRKAMSWGTRRCADGCARRVPNPVS